MTESQSTKRKYLINYDSLVDSRLAVIAQLDLALANKLVETQWGMRKKCYEESWNASFTEVEYINAYLHRNVETLRQTLTNQKLIEATAKLRKAADMDSLPAAASTKIWDILTDLIVDDRNSAVSVGSEMSIELFINTWPYNFQDDELEVLRNIATWHVNDADKITFIHKPLKELTSKWLKENQFNVCIFESFQDWVRIHHEGLGKTPIPGIEMVVPALLEKDVDTEGIEDETALTMLKNNVSPFDSLEFRMIEQVAVRFVDVKFFSNILVAGE